MSLPIATALISALAGLLGVAVGGWITAVHQKTERRHQRIREQLDGFYAPMLGLRSWILVKGERRVRMSGAADTAWRQLVATRRGNIEALKRLSEERAPDFRQIIQENNRELADEIIPRYQEMMDLFRERMALAEPSTLEHFGALVEFVDLWDRWLDGTIPPEVVAKLGHSEENLEAFYSDLAENFDRLRAELRE